MKTEQEIREGLKACRLAAESGVLLASAALSALYWVLDEQGPDASTKKMVRSFSDAIEDTLRTERAGSN